MRLPSIKKLQTIQGVTPEKAKELRLWLEVIHGFISHQRTPLVPGPVQKWIDSCYGRPGRLEIGHACIAFILTDGLDISWTVCQEQGSWHDLRFGPDWEAVNMGDPYCSTLIYRRRNRMPYTVGAWGYIPEANG